MIQCYDTLHFKENGREFINLVNFELTNFITIELILHFKIPVEILSFPASSLAIL